MVDRWDKPSTDYIEDSDNCHVDPEREICGVGGVKDKQSDEDKEEAATSLGL